MRRTSRALLGTVLALACHSSAPPPAPTDDPDTDAVDHQPPPARDAAARDRASTPAPPTDAAPPADSAASIDSAVPPASLDGPAPVAGWWDTHWPKRRSVRVAHPGKEALTDFVVPVSLPPGAAGDDLRFVAPDGALLDHELERATTTSIAWVRVPHLAAGSDGVAFTAYYGNPAAPARQGEVWPAPHAGVWHFAGDARDATLHHDDGAKTQVRFQLGMFGNAAALDYARHDHVSLINDSKLVSGAGAVTVSAWVQHTGAVHDGQDIILGIGTAEKTGHLSRVSVAISPELGLIGEANPDEGAWDVVSSPAGSVPSGQLHHLAVVIDVPARTIQLFEDGVALRAPFKGRWSARAYAATPSNRITVGCEEDESKSFFTGVIDELRVATVARSVEWLAAEARAPKMASVGPEEAAP